MASLRRFISLVYPGKEIITYDEESYSNLKELINLFCPDDWQEVGSIKAGAVGPSTNPPPVEPSPSVVAPQIASIFATPLPSEPLPLQELPIQEIPIQEIPIQPIQAQAIAPPSPPPAPHAPIDHSPTRIVHPIDDQAGRERRQGERFHVEFRVILICGNRTFRTQTTNISTGGMQVRQRIPENMLNQVCRVYVGSSDLNENVEFQCVVINDPRNANRVKFSNPDSVSQKRLDQWIKAHPSFNKHRKAG